MRDFRPVLCRDDRMFDIFCLCCLFSFLTNEIFHGNTASYNKNSEFKFATKHTQLNCMCSLIELSLIRQKIPIEISINSVPNDIYIYIYIYICI